MRNARLLQMDATDLKFDDGSFDIVYAPYVISVVPDPVKVAREMYRVCRPGGRVIILNHFLSANPLVSRVERWMSPATIHIGFKSDLDLPAFLAQSELHPKSIEKVNVPRIWSLDHDRQGRLSRLPRSSQADSQSAAVVAPRPAPRPAADAPAARATASRQRPARRSSWPMNAAST